MRVKLLLFALLCLTLSGAIVQTRAGSVEGRLIDRACYDKNPKNVGQKHVRKPIDECATACAKDGLPLAVLLPDGSTVTIVGDLAAKKNQQLIPFLMQRVRVTGEESRTADGARLIAGVTIARAD